MNKLQKAVLYILGLGVPIFFLPGIFADAFGLSKFLFLLLSVVVLLLYWAYQVYKNNAIHWRSTPFDLAVFLFGGAFVTSTLIASPNKIAALTSANGSGVIILLVLFYFLIIQTAKTSTQPSKQTDAALADGGIGTVFGAPGSPKSGRRMPVAARSSAILGLTHSAILISIWVVVNLGLELAKFKYIIPNIIQFPATNVSPAGSLLTQAVFLLIMLVYLAQQVVRNLSNLGNLRVAALPQQISLLVLLFGFFATAYKLTGLDIFPLLPYRFGWAIAVDSFKNAPIFGIGPANFVSAFTRFKPMAINQTDYWNVTFGLSSNYYLHLLSTVGLLGLGAYLFLAQRVVRSLSNVSNLRAAAKPQQIVLLAIFALQLFVPFDITLLFTEFMLLSLLGVTTSGPAASIKLVAVKEGFVRMDTDDKIVEQHWKQVEVEEE